MTIETLTPGERISMIRRRNGLNQPEVCKEAGIAIQSLVDFEKDRVSEETLSAAIDRLVAQKTERSHDVQQM